MPPDPPLPLDVDSLHHDAHEALEALGRPGSRALLPTPALVCDIDILEVNLGRMAAMVDEAGIGLRPHAKTHKSAFVATRQLAHGATGISCATVSEASAVVDRVYAEGWAGPLSVLITSPVGAQTSARRVAALDRRCDVVVAVDHPDGVDELASAVDDDRLDVVCDVDVGLGRTGVVDPEGARAVVERIARYGNLRFAGVQAYGGHLQHLAGREEREQATRAANLRVRSVIDALEGDGHEVALRTGGGTGTSWIDSEIGLLNELQCGSYAFMDREYRDALGDDPEGGFGQSLTIVTTVVSANQTGFVTVDAGLKAMATDAGPAAVLGGGEGVTYSFFGDEHGLVTQGGGRRLRRGDRLDLIPPHCDPTVDRYDALWLVQGDTVVGLAAVDARGCSQ
jgi:D-serine deaminase-like pyridoxal phosphate-dependent protein